MNNTGKKAILLLGLGLSATALVMAGCSGNTDGGKAGTDTFPGTQYDGTSAGTVELQLETSTLNVGDTSSFHFLVQDENGAGVPNIEVSCDTESGLALIEPSNGNELTGSKGAMSGVYGCAQTGSFAIACRLPVGGNKRSVKHVKCEGDVPVGFTGFAGAGGGGLGGTNGNGNASGGNLDAFVTSIKFFDGSTETSSIDNLQGTCTSTAEPFFDAFINVSVSNNSSRQLTCLSYRFTSTGFNSRSVNFTGANTVAPNGGTQTLKAIFAEAVSSGGTLKKQFEGASSPVSDGIKNIKGIVSCIDDTEAEVVLSGTASANFANFDNC